MAEMEKKTVNAMGDVCPVPLVKAKNAIAELAGSGKVEVLVDNEIAVQNLEKMAQQKGYGFLVKEKKEKEYHVEFTIILVLCCLGSLIDGPLVLIRMDSSTGTV